MSEELAKRDGGRVENTEQKKWDGMEEEKNGMEWREEGGVLETQILFSYFLEWVGVLIWPWYGRIWASVAGEWRDFWGPNQDCTEGCWGSERCHDLDVS